jgi:hypothetical protein
MKWLVLVFGCYGLMVRWLDPGRWNSGRLMSVGTVPDLRTIREAN